MRCALYKADTNGNLLLKFKSYSSYISNSPTAVFVLEEGKGSTWRKEVGETAGCRRGAQGNGLRPTRSPGPWGNVSDVPPTHSSTVSHHRCSEQP